MLSQKLVLDSGEVHWLLLAAYLALAVRYELDSLRTQLTELMVLLNQMLLISC